VTLQLCTVGNPRFKAHETCMAGFPPNPMAGAVAGTRVEGCALSCKATCCAGCGRGLPENSLRESRVMPLRALRPCTIHPLIGAGLARKTKSLV
jgi:hypothetical protein